MSIKELFNLEGKVIIITGGGGLLGRQHVNAIAECGGTPVLLDLDDERGVRISKLINEKYNVRSHFVRCDITEENDIVGVNDVCLRKYNKIDGLINNATIDPKVENAGERNFARLENFQISQWKREIDVGLTGAMLCSKVFGSEMSRKKSGVIVNIASDLGVIAPDQRIYRTDESSSMEQPVKPITYSVIKHGIIGLTKYLATYWADKNIRVNALSPGGIYNGQKDSFVKRLSNLIPMGRMANVEEYKAAIVFLCSDASSYMTGQNLIIDGGRSVW